MAVGAKSAVKPRDQRWYVVNARPGREAIARDNLRRQGYFVFLPATKKAVRHARKVTYKEAAYFPGYLFVRLDPNVDRWMPIESTVGVLRLVKAGSRPIAAPDDLIDALRSRADEVGVLQPPRQTFTQGQAVRISQGPFSDQIAVVERLSGHERVKVLLEILGQKVAVDLSQDALSQTP